MKKRLFPALFVALSALYLAACSGTGITTDPNALTILGKKTDLEKSYMTRIFDHYREVTGKNLNIISVEDSAYETAAEEMFSKGEMPDIFMHFNNADLNRFHVSEHFCYLNDESWVPELTDSAKKYCLDAEGNLLGLPFWESSVSGCYYNKTLMDQFGLKAATTQAEFDSLCQALCDINKTPICWPANGCTWMIQFGLDPIFADDPDLLKALNLHETSFSEIPEVGDMVQWIHAASQKGWFGADYLKDGWNEISTKMGSGEAVMTFIWDTWFYTDFEKGQKYSIEDFALMPVFMNTVEGGTYEGGNLNMMMVNKDSAKKEDALEFLSFCATPENYNLAFEGISTVSCFVNQTTNIQSKMVTESSKSIAEKERVSTAATKIIGYSATDLCAAIEELFQNKIDVKKCVELMDTYRLREASIQGF